MNQNVPPKYGITGGIGSGKTTVCKIFESIGIPVYYADPRAKWLLSYNLDVKNAVKKLLGSTVYYRNGRVNRQKMAELIFNNEDLLRGINEIVHPEVHKDAQKWIERQSAPYVLYEAALLVENGSYRDFSGLIVVTAKEKTRIQRVMKRDKVSEKLVRSRIKNQLPQEKKDALADYLIDNNGVISLVQQVQKIHKKILNNGKGY